MPLILASSLIELYVQPNPACEKDYPFLIF